MASKEERIREIEISQSKRGETACWRYGMCPIIAAKDSTKCVNCGQDINAVNMFTENELEIINTGNKKAVDELIEKIKGEKSAKEEAKTDTSS